MKIIVKPSQTGKTCDLIKFASENNYYIVTPTMFHLDNILREAEKLELDINFPLTANEFLEKRFVGKNIKGFVIDDADELFRILGRGVPVKGIAINGNTTA